MNPVRLAAGRVVAGGRNRARSPRRSNLLLLAGLGLLQASPAACQVVQLQAGSSSLYQAQGGSLYIRSGDSEAWLGVSDFRAARVGASYTRRFESGSVTVGDEVVPFRLPTDVFQSGQSFLGRGVGLDYRDDDVHLFAMGGTTATGYTTPYTFGARPEDPVGLVYLEAPVSSRLRISSRTLYSGLLTSIFGADWSPCAGAGGAIAAGVGAQEGYAAASGRYESAKLSARAAYVVAGDGFHRVIAPQPQASELDGENVEVTVRPMSGMSVVAARNGYAQAAAAGHPRRRGTVNQLLWSGVAAGTSATGAVYVSETPGGGSTGYSLGLGRDLGPMFRATASLLHSIPNRGVPVTMLVGTVRETVSPRLSLSQTMTHTDGNTTVSFGGNLLSNFLSFGAEYQTVYLPFADGNPFRQALMLHIRLQAIGNVQMNVDSHLGPDGVVRYTAYGSQYLCGGGQSPAPEQNPELLRYVVRGRVRDEAGAPVAGAALEIGGEVVYSDEQGSFFARRKKAGEVALNVLLDQFLTAQPYRVIDAPPRVSAGAEDADSDLMIILHRVASTSEDQRSPK